MDGKNIHEVKGLADPSPFPDVEGTVYIFETCSGKEMSVPREYLYPDQIREINGGIGKGGKTLISLDYLD